MRVRSPPHQPHPAHRGAARRLARPRAGMRRVALGGVHNGAVDPQEFYGYQVRMLSAARDRRLRRRGGVAAADGRRVRRCACVWSESGGCGAVGLVRCCGLRGVGRLGVGGGASGVGFVGVLGDVGVVGLVGLVVGSFGLSADGGGSVCLRPSGTRGCAERKKNERLVYFLR